jgi:prepilin peptidase CpaA
VLAALLLWAALAAVWDVRHRRLPNTLTLGGALTALLWLGTQGHSLAGASYGAVAAGFALALLFTLPGYALGQLGAGDVKFLAAFALMADWRQVLVVVVVSGLLAGLVMLGSAARGVMAGARVSRQSRPGRVVETTDPDKKPDKKRFLPMGAYFAVGMAVAVIRLEGGL